MTDYKNGSPLGANSPKLDDETTEGLSGTSNSLAYRVEEIEKHLHNQEKWLGAAAAASGETHVADEMGPGIAPFAFLSGNDAFGSWVQILGSSDTPIKAAQVKFDAHRFLVTSTDSTEVFHMQVAAGESADLAAAITAKNYTSFPYIAPTNNNDSGISDIMTSRVPAGVKVWARVICIGQNAKTINAYFGIHEYEG